MVEPGFKMRSSGFPALALYNHTFRDRLCRMVRADQVPSTWPCLSAHGTVRACSRNITSGLFTDMWAFSLSPSEAGGV